jgi:four helix bundle protein
MFYWELPVYQKARELVIGVDRLIKQLPNRPQTWVISRQLFDATTSIGANIAEGRGRHIGKEYERFLYYAQGSANEVDHWLRTMKDCSIGSLAELERLQALNVEVLKLLSATMSSLRRRRLQADAKTIREESVEYEMAPMEDVPF